MCIRLDSSLCGCCSLRQGTNGCVLYTAFVFVIALVAGRYHLHAARTTYAYKVKFYETGKHLAKQQRQSEFQTEDVFLKNAKAAQFWSEIISASYFIIMVLTFFAVLGLVLGYLKKNPNYLLIWLVVYNINLIILFCVTLFHVTKTSVLSDSGYWATLTSVLLAIGIYQWLIVFSYHMQLVQPHPTPILPLSQTRLPPSV